MLACAVLVLVAIFVLARWSQPSFANLPFDVEMLLLCLLLIMGGWLAKRQAA